MTPTYSPSSHFQFYIAVLFLLIFPLNPKSLNFFLFFITDQFSFFPKFHFSSQVFICLPAVFFFFLSSLPNISRCFSVFLTRNCNFNILCIYCLSHCYWQENKKKKKNPGWYINIYSSLKKKIVKRGGFFLLYTVSGYTKTYSIFIQKNTNFIIRTRTKK